VKPEAFERKWRREIGEADTNPNPALWDQLSQWVPTGERPPDSFTFREFRDRFKLTEMQGRRRLDHLLKDGKVVKVGRLRNGICYGIAPTEQSPNDKKRARRAPARARGASDH